MPADVTSPTLAAITTDATGGGIAVVANLLWQVVSERWGVRARLLTMFEHPTRPATALEKIHFSARLLAAEYPGRTDFVLFSHLALARLQTVIPRRFRRPYGVFLHGIEAWAPLDRFSREALACADVRLANSHYTATRIMNAHPTVGPVIACPLALAPQPRRPAASISWNLRDHVLLVVGRMMRSERYKGHDQLIDGWHRVVARVPDAQLVIVGGGDDELRLRRKAAAGAAASRILFTGFVDAATLHALYSRAALFALPSRAEGFGLVYLEAMAHGLACVGSVHDAAREVIVDGVTGRLIDQDDVESLVDVIAGLLADDDARASMGRAGRARVDTQFTFASFRERLCGLLGAGDAIEPDVAPIGARV